MIAIDKYWIEKEHEFEGHKGEVRSIIYFENPQPLIVTCSHYKIVRVWDATLSNKMIKVFDYHSRGVNHLLKWSPDIFMSCSFDGKIIVYSISKLEKIRVMNIYEGSKFDISKIYKMIRLTNDDFAIGNYDDNIHVISYSEGKIIKTIENRRSINYQVNFYNSINFKNDCFYFIPIAKKDGIKLVNFKTGKIEKIGDGRCYSYSSAIYQEKNSKDEIIAVGCMFAFIWKIIFLNFGKSKNDPVTRTRELDIEDHGGNKTSLYLLGKRYLISGDRVGGISVVDLYSDPEPCREISNITKTDGF